MKFLDNLCSEDDEIVDKVMYNEYWYLTRITCLYPKLNTPKWRTLTLFQFILYTSGYLYHGTLFAVSVSKLNDHKMEMFQTLHYFLIFFISAYIFILFNKDRRKYTDIHRWFGKGLYDYDEESEILRKSLRCRVQKRKKILMQMLLSYYTILGILVLCMEKYLNSYFGDDKVVLSPNLPLTLWVPYDTNSLIGCSITLFLLFIIACVVVLTCITSGVSAFIICEYLSLELKLLIHSLNRLPERTLHLYRLRHGDNTNVSIETIKENKDLSNCYRDCLKQNIIHHQNIIKMFCTFRKQQGLFLGLTFMICALIIAFSGVSIVQSEGKVGTRVLSALLCFAEIIVCYFFSHCCSQISNASENLIITLYSTKWMSLNKNEVQMIRIMMIRSQCPLLMNYRKIINIDNVTFSSNEEIDTVFMFSEATVNVLELLLIRLGQSGILSYVNSDGNNIIRRTTMKFLDDLCSVDDEIVDKVMDKEYRYLTRISCSYPKMNTPKWKALSVIRFIVYRCAG
ncbi:hypothetical protein O3M35_009074 [Rhynocoris fuscipes]|uniref:Odorant receptor n=1 Tax=Rhynocoris fuscipes TaxID=488301 RepID=A0AAW1D6Z5_9HEMI